MPGGEGDGKRWITCGSVINHGALGAAGGVRLCLNWPLPTLRLPLLPQDGCDPDGRELQDLPVHLEGTTKSYMERMEELVATRLAISDTEEGSVGVWWEGEATRLFHHNGSVRQPEALEPVVAKTRLHDPRRLVRPTRPQPIVYTSGRAAHRGASQLHRSTLTRRGKLNDHIFIKRREKEYSHLLLPPETRVRRTTAVQYIESSPLDSGHGNDHVLWLRKSTVESTEDVGESLLNGNMGYHRYSSQPTQLGMGPCEDLQVSGEEVVLRLSVPTAIRVTSPSRRGEKTRRGSSRKSSGKTSSVRKVTISAEDEELCADIATCDTLFLDTSAQETPELLAARNLKGKVKKKKNAKASTENKERVRKSDEVDERTASEGIDGDRESCSLEKVDQNDEVSGTTQPDLKISICPLLPRPVHAGKVTTQPLSGRCLNPSPRQIPAATAVKCSMYVYVTRQMNVG
ncbi:hypothetical protein O3P69_003251 [Scylla paramamosain]|uniref:Uncharacterized protein n=1 Tax=Scylla paramamosain TaxID=85552 RepID=A0AAW0UL91_SCYPA